MRTCGKTQHIFLNAVIQMLMYPSSYGFAAVLGKSYLQHNSWPQASVTWHMVCSLYNLQYNGDGRHKRSHVEKRTLEIISITSIREFDNNDYVF